MCCRAAIPSATSFAQHCWLAVILGLEHQYTHVGLCRALPGMLHSLGFFTSAEGLLLGNALPSATHKLHKAQEQTQQHSRMLILPSRSSTRLRWLCRALLGVVLYWAPPLQLRVFCKGGCPACETFRPSSSRCARAAAAALEQRAPRLAALAAMALHPICSGKATCSGVLLLCLVPSVLCSAFVALVGSILLQDL